MGVRLSVLESKVFHLSPEGELPEIKFLPSFLTRMSLKGDLSERGESSSFSMLIQVPALSTGAASRLPITVAAIVLVVCVMWTLTHLWM